MTYQQTIDYLFSRLPMFSRIGAAAYKADLNNTIALCNYLQNPQQKFKSVHIAGTNGKGSVSHMLAAILQSARYKTGLYTSPHLKDFRERIKVNGEMIAQDFVVDFTRQIQPMIEEIEPSFFEITVAMAFEYFAQKQVDIAVIEVGLGGRLDSTNIITPLLSIITNISRDHTNLLGNTLAEIAYEKAGIIKENIPVIIGETLPETKTVFEKKAAEMNTQIVYASAERWIADWHIQQDLLRVEVAEHRNDERKHYVLDLPGLYQTKNILPVLEAVHKLNKQGFVIEENHISEGLKNVKKLTGLFGRWQVMRHNPLVVMDVGHNEDGIRQIIQQVELTTYLHLHIVIGFVKDKEIDKVLALLPAQATYYFTKAQIPRALPEDELAEMALPFQLHGNTYPNVNEAIKAALDKAHANDLLLICGSVFLVGEVDDNLFAS